MTDLHAWDHDDPFEKWRPTPAESARVLELWQCCVTDDPRFGEVFDAVCADVLSERNLPQVLVAVLVHGRDALASCPDQMLVRARLSADVRSAREQAREEMIDDDES